jgi:hypothetical protein
MVSLQLLMICLLLAVTSAKEFSFRILFKMQNLDTNVFSEESYLGLRDSIAATLNIPVSKIGLGRVDDEMERAVFVSVSVSLDSKDYSSLSKDPGEIQSELFAQLHESVQSKEFSETLKNAAISYSATEFANVHISDMSFEEFIISKDSTSELNRLKEQECSEQTKECSEDEVFPTSTPSIAPTSVPSSVPSSLPTSVQTETTTTPPITTKFLQFSGFFALFNVSSQSLSPEGQQALVQTIADLTDLPSNQLVYQGITNELQANSFAGFQNRKLLMNTTSLWDMVIEVKFTLPVQNFPQFLCDPLKIFGFIKTVLQESISHLGGEKNQNHFTNELRINSLSSASELAFVNVRRINFTDIILLEKEPSDNTHNSGGGDMGTMTQTKSPSLIPTVSPSFTHESFVIDVFWGVNHLETLSEIGELTFLQTIANILDISVSQITTMKIKIMNSLQKTMEIETRTVLDLNDYPEFHLNSSKVYSFATNLLGQAVLDNSFNVLLHSEAKHMTATELYEANVFEVAFKEFILPESVLPTAVPTVKPTKAPNNTPTAPVIIPPSGSPVTSPTRSPQQSSIMTFQADFYINNVTTTYFSQSSILALIQSIEDLTQNDDYYKLIETITIITVHWMGNHRRLRGLTASNDVNTDHSFVVGVQLTTSMNNPQLGNAVYQNITNFLLNTVNNGQLESIYHTNAHQMSAKESYNATFGGITFGPMSFTSSSSSSSSFLKLPFSWKVFATILFFAGAIVAFIIYAAVRRYYYQEKIFFCFSSKERYSEQEMTTFSITTTIASPRRDDNCSIMRTPSLNPMNKKRSVRLNFDEIYEQSEKYVALDTAQANRPEELEALEFMTQSVVNHHHGLTVGNEEAEMRNLYQI